MSVRRQLFEQKIFFSDEAYFTLGGYVNKQNCCIRGSENPQVIEERPLHAQKFIVCCALCFKGEIGCGYRPICVKKWSEITSKE